MTIATITPATDPGDLPVADIPALTRIAVSEKVGPAVANRQPKALEKRTNTLVAKVNEIATAINGQSYASKHVPILDSSSLLIESGVAITGPFSGGSLNIGVGYRALTRVTSGQGNTAVGPYSGDSMTTGSSNVSVGGSTLQSATTATNNVAVGISVLQYVTTGTGNTGVGTGALNHATGNYNVGIGQSAGFAVTTGSYSVAVGTGSLSQATTGSRNVATGGNSLYYVTSSSNNSACGFGAGMGHQSGDRNTYLGYYAGQTSDVGVSLESRVNCTLVGSYTVVTGDNQVQLGDSLTTPYAYGTLGIRSDSRDKADIRDTVLGLDFVSALRPVDFRWDYRIDYTKTVTETVDGVEVTKTVPAEKDGSKKRSRFHHGLIAQEVAAVISSTGIDFGGYQDHTIGGGDDVLSIGYGELFGPLIKSIQQLKALNDTLAARVTALESASKVAP